MQIKILNKGNRNQLICERRDGGVEITDLGPTLPFHDIAHFIVERQLKLKRGFYGNIYIGYSVKQLSDKNTIRTLPIQSAVAEITTRALQSLGAGACTIEQFSRLINEEFELYSINFELDLEKKKISQMLSDYKKITSQWEQLKEGEGLELKLEIDDFKETE
jgi:hypothetical protein